MIVAYADPPYIGQSKKHYEGHPDYAGEVNHVDLVAKLVREYPDGWDLSLSCKSLQSVLSMCPDDVRVCGWMKPWSNMLPGIRVQYSWEPVIVSGGRQGPHVKGDPLLRDWMTESEPALPANPEGFTFRTLPDGSVIGRKPRAFCFWLFEVLGLEPQDELHDLFPGNGAVTDAWQRWRDQGCPRLKQNVKIENSLFLSAPGGRVDLAAFADGRRV
jgi:hypothetical protein